jgi:LEA14-like dessication related protein
VKTITIAIIVIVVVAALVVGAFGYQQVRQRQALEDIKISVDGVSIVSISLTSATLNISLRFTNPTTTPATLDRTDYTLFINNVNVGSGQNVQQVVIPAGGSLVVPQIFTVSYSGGLQGIWSILQQGGGEWRLVGTAFFDTFLGTVAVPYDLTGTISR